MVAFLPILAVAQDFGKIEALTETADYDGAKKLILASLNTADTKTVSLLKNKLGEVLILQGYLDEAEKELSGIDFTGDRQAEAITKTNLGFLYLNMARNDLALDNLKQGLNIFQSTGRGNTLEAAKCLAYLSQAYASMGKLNQAEENGLLALQIRQNLKGEDSEVVAASYNDLGLVYGQRDPEKGLEYYEKALSVYEKIRGKDHPKIAIANTNIGLMYRKMKLYGDANNNLEAAEAIWKKIYPNGHPNQALALFNLGVTYSQMGDKKNAMSYYDKALSVYKKSYGAKHPDIAYVLNQIGILNLSDSKYDEALKNFQEALCANAPEFTDLSVTRNPLITDYYNAKVMLYSLHQKALAYESRHYGKTLRFDDLCLALSGLQSCDSLIDDIRFHSSDENDKLELGASANEVYEDGVRIAHAMSQITIEFKAYREIAFYFAEKSKSAVLQESIADAEAKSFAGIPVAMLDQEKEIKSSISTISQKLSQKPTPDEEKILRESLFAENRKYEAFIKDLEKNYPDYFNLKFNPASPSIPELQKILPQKTALISYFISDAGKRLYTFVITRTKSNIYSSTLPPDFDRLIKGFNNSLYYTVFDSYRAAANQLSSLLLRGIPRSAKELVIIPSGRLSTLPFEALSEKPIGKDLNFSNVEYLVKKAGISYEFSSGLLLQKSRSENSSKEQSIFLCAPVTFPEKDNLDDLPGSAHEVRNIASLFPSNSFVATGGDASEGLVKSGKINNYRYLHFATHGIVDETSPELSRIFLQTSTQDDGNVFSGEIFNLTLSADLTVLSACQTGLGKFSKGEGVIGLSRALVYAGSRNIMVSYWSVADESTSELMTDFYKNLINQSVPDYRKALQDAKVSLINDRKYSAPYYWAPFVLIGF